MTIRNEHHVPVRGSRLPARITMTMPDSLGVQRRGVTPCTGFGSADTAGEWNGVREREGGVETCFK